MAEKCYACVKNRNTTQGLVAKEYMLMLGASTNRGLTGQGLGTKMAGVQAHLDGLTFARGSHDETGPYLAWYETEGYAINGTERRRVVLKIQRPGGEVESHQMTVDTNMFQSAWANNSIGRQYPIIREPILDAADEDPHFKIDKVDKIEFSPRGWTYTYVEIPDDQDLPDEERSAIGLVLDTPDYYFRKLHDVTWLSSTVGIGDMSSVNETRLYITAEGAPLAYVGFSTGDPSPESAFDYVLRETDGTKWASMPKRTLESSYDAQQHIRAALMECTDHQVLLKVFRKIIDGGWEKSFNWWGTWNNITTVRKALDIICGNRPIVAEDDEIVAMRATLEGVEFKRLPVILYELGKLAGMETLLMRMGMRESGETRYSPMSALEKKVLAAARANLSKRMPWVDCSTHLYLAIDSDFLGVHNRDYSGSDVIGLNFDKMISLVGHRLSLEQIMDEPGLRSALILEAEAIILHEMTHHKRIESSMEDHNHGDGFVKDLARVCAPPVTA